MVNSKRSQASFDWISWELCHLTHKKRVTIYNPNRYILIFILLHVVVVGTLPLQVDGVLFCLFTMGRSMGERWIVGKDGLYRLPSVKVLEPIGERLFGFEVVLPAQVLSNCVGLQEISHL